jgi:diacylglycerol kinase (ATP)
VGATLRRVAQRTLVIVNPRSRNGSTGRSWPRVEAQLRHALGPLEVEHTRAPRDAERLAREGVRAGIERIIVAGGDGTLSEVASGLLGADLGSYAEIGLLPFGTASDFARTLGVPRDLRGAIDCLATGAVRRVDAGRVHYTGFGGDERVSHFVNVSSFGISGLVDDLVNRTTKVLGGAASFLVGALRAIRRYRSAPVAIRLDGELVHDRGVVLAAAGNGCFFGGGMKVAPKARVDDGLLDLVIVSDLSKAQLVRKLPKIYRGTHIDDAAVSFHRARSIAADSAPGEVMIEFDGEPLGTLPARYEVLPGALSIVGPMP